jgi:hypothetical protein
MMPEMQAKRQCHAAPNVEIGAHRARVRSAWLR